MKSILFKVDHFDTVKACMVECLKVQSQLAAQKVRTDLKTHKHEKYHHIHSYELIFKNDDDYMIYQFIA